jgi:hypothetical protein
MLSRALSLARKFSSAPYNPMKYLRSYVPTKMPGREEVYEIVNTAHQGEGPLVQNLRHINPVRQSGPVPPFDGPFTMEDILNNIYYEYAKLGDQCYASTDTEEIMRRVPGTTREEAEYIRGLGLTPDDEVELAYWAKNLGLDIYYPMNNTYIARQIVTNSKGEKVEIVYPFQAAEDIFELSVDTALQDRPYLSIRHWEAFSGDEWYKYINTQDLGVPDTWIEYEKNSRFAMGLIGDQLEELPDQIRPWPSPKHPNARKELWRSQEHLKDLDDLSKPDWNVPK